MNKLLIALFMVGSVPAPALADYYQRGGVESTNCFKKVYREEYIPGTASNPGRVRRYYEQQRVACAPKRAPRTEGQHMPPADDNSCVEGSILGGVAGAAAGGTLATKENWIWSIPMGIIGGAMVGCQVDGG